MKKTRLSENRTSLSSLYNFDSVLKLNMSLDGLMCFSWPSLTYVFATCYFYLRYYKPFRDLEKRKENSVSPEVCHLRYISSGIVGGADEYHGCGLFQSTVDATWRGQDLSLGY